VRNQEGNLNAYTPKVSPLFDNLRMVELLSRFLLISDL
jgi:hypothetical protein